jgi:hypothetical protein
MLIIDLNMRSNLNRILIHSSGSSYCLTKAMIPIEFMRYEKNVETVMVINSTNMNKTNNHLSS